MRAAAWSVRDARARARARSKPCAGSFVSAIHHSIPPRYWRGHDDFRATIANEFTEAVGELYTASLSSNSAKSFLVTFLCSPRPIHALPPGTRAGGRHVNRSRLLPGALERRVSRPFGGGDRVRTRLARKSFSARCSTKALPASTALFTESTRRQRDGSLLNPIRQLIWARSPSLSDTHRIMAGTFSQYGRYSRSLLRALVTDFLLSAPSIVIDFLSTTDGTELDIFRPGGARLLPHRHSVVVRTPRHVLLIPNTLRKPP